MNNLLILVVEDDAPVRNLIGTTLKTHGYDYITATNGESAVMQASSHNPDIVLLDLGLPDIDGVYLIALSKRLIKTCTISRASIFARSKSSCCITVIFCVSLFV